MVRVDKRFYGYIVVIILALAVGLLAQIYYSNIYVKPGMETQVGIKTTKSELMINEFKRVIETKIKDDRIVCTMIIYYSKESFNSILDNWNEYYSLITKNISKFKEASTSIKDLNIRYQSSSSSVLIYFIVDGAVSKYNGRCTATYLWLLRPLGLDFIEDHFNEYNDRLTWTGMINGVNYNITILLPRQDVPYIAWGKSVGHCHGHVWWPCQS